MSFYPADYHKELEAIKAQKDLSAWLTSKLENDFANNRCFAVTLLFVEGISRQKGLDQYGNFTRYLNRKVYGHAHERFHSEQNTIKQIAIMEGGFNESLVHYHSTFVNPYNRNFSDCEFEALIRQCWLEQSIAMKNKKLAVDIKKINNLQGWIGYCTKTSSKSFNGIECSCADMLDLNNSFF